MTDFTETEPTVPPPAERDTFERIRMATYEHRVGTLLRDPRWDDHYVVTDRGGFVFLMCCPRHVAQGWPLRHEDHEDEDYEDFAARDSGTGFYLHAINGLRLDRRFEVTDVDRSDTCRGATHLLNDDSD